MLASGGQGVLSTHAVTFTRRALLGGGGGGEADVAALAIRGGAPVGGIARGDSSSGSRGRWRDNSRGRSRWGSRSRRSRNAKLDRYTLVEWTRHWVQPLGPTYT